MKYEYVRVIIYMLDMKWFSLSKWIYFRFQENRSVLVVTMVFISHFCKKERQLQKKWSLICPQVFSLIQMLRGNIYIRKMWNFVIAFFIMLFTHLWNTQVPQKENFHRIIIINPGDDFNFINMDLIYHT